MSDTPTATTADVQPEVEVKKELTVTISLPDTITVGMYVKYAQARLKWINELAAKNESAPENIARFHGAMKLVDAGYVHITGDGADKLKSYLANADSLELPSSIVGLIVRTIALPVEFSLDSPLPESLKLS